MPSLKFILKTKNQDHLKRTHEGIPFRINVT